MSRGNLNYDSQSAANLWLNRIPTWDAKRGVFLFLGVHGTGKTHVLKKWAKTHSANFVNLNLELLKRAFPNEPDAGLIELGKSVNDDYVASKLEKAFRALALDLSSNTEHNITILDHIELLLDYPVPLEPQALLGDLAARTGHKFILSAPGRVRDDVIYIQERNRFNWTIDEAQYLQQWFQLEFA